MYSANEHKRSIRYRWIAIFCSIIFHLGVLYLLHTVFSGNSEEAEAEPTAMVQEIVDSEQPVQLTGYHIDDFA